MGRDNVDEKEHKKYLYRKARKERSTYYNIFWDYKRCYYKNFPYDKLDKISYIKRPGRVKDEDKDTTFNDVIIMADTETSKKKYTIEPHENHVVAWTISLRAYGKNICTLYGSRPTEMMDCFYKLLSSMKGDKTICYFHNMGYDYIFLRKFLFKKFGTPCKQLNVKPFYPIYIEFPGGLILRDSLILSQCSIEKWSNDLKTDHRKAVGKWDYEKIRNQSDGQNFTDDELEYIEHDTLAGVECIDKLMNSLNKKICSMPWTMTGIVREEVKKEGKNHHWHDKFVSMLPTWEQQLKLEKVYHGGFTHGNRHFYGKLIQVKDGFDWVEGYDFSSSYPYCLETEKMPCEKFHPEENITIDEILENSDQYAYIFKLTLYGVEIISDNIPMPMLQFSKCEGIKNPVLDNGRVVQADYIAGIYMNEIDLEVFASMYKYKMIIVSECECARKDYLPKWFTDLVYRLFQEKTMLKGGDPVDYALAKGRL